MTAIVVGYYKPHGSTKLRKLGLITCRRIPRVLFRQSQCWIVMIPTCPTARMKMIWRLISRTQLLVGASVFKMRPGSSTGLPRMLLLQTERQIILPHSSSLTVYLSRKNRKPGLSVQLRFLQGLAFHRCLGYLQRLGHTPGEWPATECAMNFSSGGYLIPKRFLAPHSKTSVKDVFLTFLLP